MRITEPRPHLYRISLNQGMTGFENFIGSWVFDGDVKFLVDVGPKASLHQLVEGLRILKMERLDFVFLTHIHIDHAGGTGSFLNGFPEAKVICHPVGVKHLVDPQKLWEGSKKILGELAVMYGEIDPVPEDRIVSADEFNQEGFRVIKTPGHAAHHISVVHGNALFAGEAGGVFLELKDGIYLRPATPPKFILEEAVESIDTLLTVHVRDICYGHAGIHPDPKGMLTRYRAQLFLWKDVIAEQLKQGETDTLMDRCIEALLEKDELFGKLRQMGEEEKPREFYFIRNNILGYIEYLRASQLG